MNSKASTSSKSSLLVRFMRYYKPHIRFFILDLLCALVISIVDLSFPLVSRYAMQTLLPGMQYSAFFQLMLILLCAYLLRTGLTFVVTYFGHCLGVLMEADMRRDLFTHLQSLSFRFYDHHRTGQLMSRVTTDLFDITELAHHGPEDLFLSFVTVVGAIAIMFTIQWKLALLLSILVPVGIIFTLYQRGRMMQASRRVKERQAGINAGLESSISGARVAKAFTNESYEIKKFERSNEKFRRSKGEFYAAMGVFLSGMDLFTNIFQVAVVAFGGYLIMGGELSNIELLTFSLYVAAFIAPIRKFSMFTELYANGMAGFQRFQEIMDQQPDIADLPGAKPLEDVQGDILLKDVVFSYNDKTTVLSHINLHIKPGETLALVGPSGGGKTTLCHLLPRFYEIDEGEIRIDGQEIRGVTLQSLRENMGIVSQDVFLFADTIRENIRYGRITATDAEIIEAAKRAEIHDMIMEMENGYDTEVGDRGVRLSGGQKQRVSIARIFLKNPPILILDEATSALDSITEAKIQKAFEALAEGRTTLVIAHRLSTVQNADVIIVLSDEGILEQGSHTELIKKEGAYAKLYHSQFAKP